MKDKELKPTANTVGAFIGRPLIEGNAPYKKEYQNKTECKHCRGRRPRRPALRRNYPSIFKGIFKSKFQTPNTNIQCSNNPNSLSNHNNCNVNTSRSISKYSNKRWTI